MGEAFIVRKGGVVSDTTAAPTITIVTETGTDVTFTLTNNDDNTAIVTYEIDDQIGGVELAAAATSGNITVALAAGTYTLTAYATVVGEVASTSDAAVEIVAIPAFELLFDSTGTVTFPTSQIDITGLSIGKNDELRLVYTFVCSNEAVAVRMYVNDLTTESLYTTQRLEAFGTTFTAAKFNSAQLGEAGLSTTRKAQGTADIKVSNNDILVWQSHQLRNFGSNSSASGQNVHNVVLHGQSVSTITKLSIKPGSGNFVSGARFRLYKVNTGEA